MAGFHVAKLRAQSTILLPDRRVLNKYVTGQKATPIQRNQAGHSGARIVF
jgi:hypothetical protein